MNIRTTTAFATGAVFALVLGTGTAYAANGGHFVLGGNNYESREASLNNSNGTALTLQVQVPGTPSLKVNRTTKVPNLNADLVDGLKLAPDRPQSSRSGRAQAPVSSTTTGPLRPTTTPSWPSQSARAAAR